MARINAAKAQGAGQHRLADFPQLADRRCPTGGLKQPVGLGVRPPVHPVGALPRIVMRTEIEMTLLSNNPMTVVGLEGYDLKIVSRRPIPQLES